MIASQSYDPLHYGVLSSDDLRIYYTTEKGRSQEKTCYSNPPKGFASVVFKTARVIKMVVQITAPQIIGSNKQRKKISENGTKVPKRY